MSSSRVLACVTAMLALIGTFSAGAASAMSKHVFCPACAFGGEGSGNGQFNGPAGVAASGASGDVYVVDKGNGRVERFTSAGSYLGQFNGAGSPTGEFLNPQAIAIDQSTSPLDPSAGDVYVADVGHHAVDKFSATGTYQSQVTTGQGGSPLGEIYGIAVDEAGALWIYQETGGIDSYTNGEPNEFAATRGSGAEGLPQRGFAVGSERLFVLARERRIGDELDSSGGLLVEELAAQEGVNALATDGEHGHAYLVESSRVVVADLSGAATETFGEGHLTEADGVAVNPQTETAYVADKAANMIEVFEAIVTPDVETAPATNLEGEGKATLNGAVNPDGLPVTACEFEYGTTTAYGATVECAPEPGAGTEAVPVSSTVSIAPGAEYHYRLVASNANGGSVGADRTFIAPGRPVITAEAVTGIRASESPAGTMEATVTASVNPGSLATTYAIEYGPSTGYGSQTALLKAGAGLEPVSVQVSVGALLPATEYHARVVASNSFGTVDGGDLSFTTPDAAKAASTGLPDGRVYEAVSPVASEGNASTYVPGAGFPYLTAQSEHGIPTFRPFSVAASGEAVVFPGDAPPGGGGGYNNQGGGDQYIARRGATGAWTARDIQPVGNFQAEYLAFSSDLSVGLLFASTPLESSVSQELYAHDTTVESGFVPVDPERPSGDRAEFVAMNAGAPGARAGLHNVFTSSGALLAGEGSQAVELREAVTASNGEGRTPSVVYDSVEGVIHVVSVLPNGKADVHASVRENPARVISSDGARIFWTDTDTEATGENPTGGTRVFARRGDSLPGATTIQLDEANVGAPGPGGGGHFWSASTDGGRVFFTDEGALTEDSTASAGAPDLYERNLTDGTLVDLTVDSNIGEHAAVRGVLGAGSDGSYVYFVADGALAAKSTPHECEATGCNLYVRHEGTTSLITVLSPEDNTSLVPFDGEGEGQEVGDWRERERKRTAEITPSGQSLIFMSQTSLTGYDNEGLTEVFDYEAAAGRLTCISCNPTGEPPVPTNFDTYHRPLGAFFPINSSTSHDTPERPRVISDDGGRVFFDSGEPLVSQDHNGWLDVYEWEQDKVGTCRKVGGCVFLVSSGVDPDSSYLLGTSASGNDAFVITRSQLAVQDRNGNDDVYDARVGGVQQPVPAGGCTGEACAHIPPAPPVFGGSASSAFSGSGNLKPVKPPPALTTKQKLAKALKACRAKRRGRLRTRCEAQARRRFGATRKHVQSKKYATTKRRRG